VQLYRYFVSQSSEFCCHKPLCCFSTSVYFYCLFRYRLSPENFGCTLVQLTRTNSTEHSPCCGASSRPISQEILRLYETRRCITVFTGACNFSLHWARWIHSTPSHPVSWKAIRISCFVQSTFRKIETDMVTAAFAGSSYRNVWFVPLYRDRTVGIALGYGLDGVLGFDSRRWLGIFLFTTASRMALEPTQPPTQWLPGALWG
jgi:hypothetical protein